MLRFILTVILLLGLGANATHQQPRGHMLALCATEDGLYRIFVLESKAIIPSLRRIFLAIKNEQGSFVASYWGKIAPGPSKKYGNVKYVDNATDGSQFEVDAPSELHPGFQVNASISIAGKTFALRDGNMQCSAYNRQLPGR